MNHLVLDMKPEGHQFKKLREAVLAELPEGVQQHVLTAFRNYLLITEMAHQILHHEQNWAYRDIKLQLPFNKIQTCYNEPEDVEPGDFSERLLSLVDGIIEKGGALKSISTTAEITELIQPRDRFVYYRGIRRSGGRRDQAEYFGCGVIGQIWSDPAVPLDAPQRRWAWYCEIEN